MAEADPESVKVGIGGAVAGAMAMTTPPLIVVEVVAAVDVGAGKNSEEPS